MAVEIPIIVKSKRVPWVETLAIEGPDYSGATFKMELRTLPGGTGGAVVTLNNAAAGTQGISATYDAAYVDPITADVFAATVLLFRIDETTMEALPAASPTDASVSLYHDLHIDPVSGDKFLAIYGSYDYSPGVTI